MGSTILPASSPCSTAFSSRSRAACTPMYFGWAWSTPFLPGPKRIARLSRSCAGPMPSASCPSPTPRTPGRVPRACRPPGLSVLSRKKLRRIRGCPGSLPPWTMTRNGRSRGSSITPRSFYSNFTTGPAAASPTASGRPLPGVISAARAAASVSSGPTPSGLWAEPTPARAPAEGERESPCAF